MQTFQLDATLAFFTIVFPLAMIKFCSPLPAAPSGVLIPLFAVFVSVSYLDAQRLLFLSCRASFYCQPESLFLLFF
jgi:hypothetical protein